MAEQNRESLMRETVYDRCAYVGCYNGKFINGRRLFHFPAETDRRLEMWIERSGNFRLRTWAATSLRKAGLCADHFDEKSFTNASRKTLRRNVVPRHYTEDLKYKAARLANRENNENNKNVIRSDELKDPLAFKRSSSPAGELASEKQICEDDAFDESTLQSEEYMLDEPRRKVSRTRSPSPLVEFIVEELDETLICDQSISPVAELVEGEQEEKEGEREELTEEVEEEKEEEQDNEEEAKEMPISSDQMEEVRTFTIDESGLTVNKSTSKVRTYYRSKNHRPVTWDESQRMKLEFSEEESAMVIGDENMINLSPVISVVRAAPSSKKQISRLNNAICTNINHEKMLSNLRSENKQLRKTIRLLKQNLRRSKARETKYMRVRTMLRNIDEFLNIQECMNPVARAMVKLALHKHKAPYEKEEKEFATQLYRSSSTAFNRLRRAGCNFPGRGTMKRWLAEVNEEESLNDFVMPEADDEVAYGMEEPDDEDLDETRDICDMVDNTHESIDATQEEVVDIPGIFSGIHDTVGMHELVIDMNESVANAEQAIDELVEQLEVKIEGTEQEEYIEAFSSDNDEERRT